MAVTVTVGLQKGGVAKTTTSAVLSYILARKHRVLSIDMDSQGSLTEVITGTDDLDDFRGHTVLEALRDGDVTPYLQHITDTWDLVPSDDFLATMDQLQVRGVEPALLLRRALGPVVDSYDYIIIDTPPALSRQTINALAASNQVIIPFEPSKLPFSALRNFLGTVDVVRSKLNPDLRIGGILQTIADGRRKDVRFFQKKLEETYGDQCPIVRTVIPRSAHIGRIPLMGFVDNPELTRVVADYEPVTEELFGIAKTH